jgi:hypothetical protein
MRKHLFRPIIFLAAFVTGLVAVFWFSAYTPVSDSTRIVRIVDRASVSSLACLDNDRINVEFVSRGIRSGVNVDSTDDGCIRMRPSPGEETLLMKVAYSGDTDVAELLLEHGANINAQDGYGNTPLSYAVRAENLTMVRFLVEKGANIDLGGDQGKETPLMLAAMQGNVELIDCLLDGSATIDARDTNRSTSLMFAAGFNQPSAVRELLRRGSNQNLRDKRGLTAADYAKHGFPKGYLFARE